VVKIVPTSKTETEIAAERKERDDKARNDFWLTASSIALAVITFLLVIVGVGQLYMFWQQLRVIRQSVADTKKAAEAAALGATAAKESAEATKESVALAKQTTVRQLRAYISTKDISIYAATPGSPSQPKSPPPPITAGTQPEARLTFKNSGQTPAYDVEFKSDMSLQKWPLPAHSVLPLPATFPGGKDNLGPGDTYIKYDGFKILTNNQFQSLQSGTHALFVYGEVGYKDIFGETRTFKYRYFTGGPIGIRGLNLVAHEEGNDAD
jgi:hypothetical protein